MKRLLLILSLLCPLLATAAPVNESVCRKIATEFLKSKNFRVEMSQLKLVPADPVVKASNQAPAYYIYEAPSKGFVIVAGDDSVEPIIGYSTENGLLNTGSAPNFDSWMQMWEKIIDSNRKHQTKASSKVAQAWMDVTAPAKTTEDPSNLLIETALWDQGSPYNLLCPKDDGGTCVTGCTATALAIIMRHHKWPDAGVGTLPGYKTGSITIPDIELGQKYDWDNMLMEYDGTANYTQKMAVATLMYHVGVMIQSSYTSSGTGSHSIYIAANVSNYMKYEQTRIYTYRDFYSKEGWMEQIKKSIQNNCPIHYSGWAADNSGHAFVLDGYDEQDKVHINFGWGGANNGYFVIPELGGYTEGQIGIFNLKPDEGEVAGNLSIEPLNGSRGVYVTRDGKEVTLFEVGVPMDIKVGTFWNYSAVDFEGEIGVGKWNRDGELVEVLGSDEATIGRLEPTLNLGVADVDYSDCVLTTPIRVGDRLCAMFKVKGGEWEICPYDRTYSYFKGEIEIADTRTIEESTKINIDIAAGTAEVKVKDGVTVKLLDAAGTEVNSGISATETGVVIDVKSVGEGTYKLCLTKDYENVEMEVKL